MGIIPPVQMGGRPDDDDPLASMEPIQQEDDPLAGMEPVSGLESHYRRMGLNEAQARDVAQGRPTITAAKPLGFKDRAKRFFGELVEGTAFQSPEEKQAKGAALAANERVRKEMKVDRKDWGTGDLTTLPPSRIVAGGVRGVVSPIRGMAGYINLKTGHGEGVERFLGEVQEALTPINPNFADTTAEGVASTVGLLIPGVGVEAGVLKIAKWAPSFAKVAQYGGAFAMAAFEAAGEAYDAYRENLAKGMDPEQAEARADKLFWANVALLTATNKIGWFNAEGKFTKRTVRTMVEEGFQEGGQQVMGNIATDRPLTEGVVEATAVGGLSAGTIGTGREFLRRTRGQRWLRTQAPEGSRFAADRYTASVSKAPVTTGGVRQDTAFTPPGAPPTADLSVFGPDFSPQEGTAAPAPQQETLPPATAKVGNAVYNLDQQGRIVRTDVDGTIRPYDPSMDGLEPLHAMDRALNSQPSPDAATTGPEMNTPSGEGISELGAVQAAQAMVPWDQTRRIALEQTQEAQGEGFTPSMGSAQTRETAAALPAPAAQAMEADLSRTNDRVEQAQAALKEAETRFKQAEANIKATAQEEVQRLADEFRHVYSPQALQEYVNGKAPAVERGLRATPEFKALQQAVSDARAAYDAALSGHMQNEAQVQNTYGKALHGFTQAMQQKAAGTFGNTGVNVKAGENLRTLDQPKLDLGFTPPARKATAKGGANVSNRELERGPMRKTTKAAPATLAETPERVQSRLHTARQANVVNDLAAQAGLNREAWRPFDPSKETHQAFVESRIASAMDNLEAIEKVYNAIPETKGGRILNGDILEMIFTGDADTSVGIHGVEPWAEDGFNMTIFQGLWKRKLAATPSGAPVWFMAGGQGAGKSTVSQGLVDGGEAALVYDNPGHTAARLNIPAQMALKAGKAVSVLLVVREGAQADQAIADRQEKELRTIDPKVRQETAAAAAKQVTALSQSEEGAKMAFWLAENRANREIAIKGVVPASDTMVQAEAEGAANDKHDGSPEEGGDGDPGRAGNREEGAGGHSSDPSRQGGGSEAGFVQPKKALTREEKRAEVLRRAQENLQAQEGPKEEAFTPPAEEKPQVREASDLTEGEAHRFLVEGGSIRRGESTYSLVETPKGYVIREREGGSIFDKGGAGPTGGWSNGRAASELVATLNLYKAFKPEAAPAKPEGFTPAPAPEAVKAGDTLWGMSDQSGERVVMKVSVLAVEGGVVTFQVQHPTLGVSKPSKEPLDIFNRWASKDRKAIEASLSASKSNKKTPEQELKNSIKAKWEAILKKGGDPGTARSGFDPEMLAMAVDLLMDATELGARKFADAMRQVRDVVGEIPERMHRLMEAAWDALVDTDPEAAEARAAGETVARALTQADTSTEESQDGVDQLSQQPGTGDPGAPAPAGPEGVGGPGAKGHGGGGGRGKGTGSKGKASAEKDSRTGGQHGPAGNERGGGDPDSDTVRPGAGSGLTPFRPNVDALSKINLSTPAGRMKAAKGNLNAIKTLKSLQEAGRLKEATAEEREALAQWVGWGALDKAVDYAMARNVDYYLSRYGSDNVERFLNGEAKRWYQDGWMEVYKAIEAELGEEGVRRAKASTVNAHYTAPEIIQAMWGMLDRFGFKGGNVLEPSMGSGLFFGLMPEGVRSASSLTGVELEPFTADLAQALYPESEVFKGGYQDAKIQPNSVDLVISNVPFDQSVRLDGMSLHNFFFKRGLEHLKPGGLMVAITSTGTMDSLGNAHRKVFDESADLVGAIRLPNNAFSKNAGTEVTTDIVILRKRADGKRFDSANSWMGTVDLNVGENRDGEPVNVYMNEYFSRNPEQIIGTPTVNTMYGDGSTMMSVEWKGTPDEFRRALQAAVNRLPEGWAESGVPTNVLQEETSHGHSDGAVAIQGGKAMVHSDGVWMTPAQYVGAKTDKAAKELNDSAKTYVELIDVLQELQAQEATEATDEALEPLRKKLNKLYDAFVGRRGGKQRTYFFQTGVNKHVKDDPAYFEAMALEREVKTIDPKTGDPVVTYEKADILKRRVGSKPVLATSASSPEEAVILSVLGKGRVDVQYMADLLGQPVDEVRANSLNNGLIFETPKGDIEPSWIYLSGEVRKKLREAKAANEQAGGKYDRNVAELEKALPPEVPANALTVRLGAAWVPVDAYNDFLRDAVGLSGGVTFDQSLKQVIFDPRTRPAPGGGDRLSKWQVRMDGHHATVSAEDIVQSALMWDNSHKATYRVETPGGGTKTVHDPVVTEVAMAKVLELRTAFNKWLREEGNRHSAEVARIYNETFNSLVEPKWPTLDMASFPGQSATFNGKPFRMEKFQVEGVFRGLVQNSLYAHDVGSGKTITGGTLAHELKRLGVAKKPVISTMRSVAPGFAAQMRQLYPSARILVRPDNPSAKTRKVFLQRLATMDFDMAILTHEDLGSIPDSAERINAYVNDQMDAVEEAIRGLQARKISMESRDPNAKAIRDRLDYLENLRKLTNTNQEEEAEGEPEAKGKRKATGKQAEKSKNSRAATLDDLLKRKTDNVLDWDKLGIDALIVDESHQFKRLDFYTQFNQTKGIDKESSKRGLSLLLKTRAVADRGGRIALMTGTPITNTMAEIWTNLRYLRPDILEGMGISAFDDFVKTFGDIYSMPEIDITGNIKSVERLRKFANLPELQSALFQVMHRVPASQITRTDLPKVANGGIQNVLVPASKATEDFMEFLRGVYWSWNAAGQIKQSTRYVPGTLYTRATQASMDIRMVDPEAKHIGGGKIEAMVGKAMAHYKETMDERGAQAIFAEHYHSPGNYMGFPIEEHDRFNMFKEIKRQLMEAGVPESEIVDRIPDGDKAREAVFDKVRSGEVRFIIGGTKTLGTGVNIQDRLIAAHHLQLPLTPAEFEQRNGRIVRSGNRFSTVHVYTYAVEGGPDAFFAQVLSNKQKFIEQVMDKKVSDRGDLADVSEDSGASFDDMAALFSGDSRVAERMQVQAQLNQLESDRDTFEQAQSVARRKVAFYDGDSGYGSKSYWEKQLQNADALDRLTPKGVVTKILQAMEENAIKGTKVNPDGTRSEVETIPAMRVQMPEGFTFEYNPAADGKWQVTRNGLEIVSGTAPSGLKASLSGSIRSQEFRLDTLGESRRGWADRDAKEREANGRLLEQTYSNTEKLEATRKKLADLTAAIETGQLDRARTKAQNLIAKTIEEHGVTIPGEARTVLDEAEREISEGDRIKAEQAANPVKEGEEPTDNPTAHYARARALTRAAREILGMENEKEFIGEGPEDYRHWLMQGMSDAWWAKHGERYTEWKQKQDDERGAASPLAMTSIVLGGATALAAAPILASAYAAAALGLATSAGVVILANPAMRVKALEIVQRTGKNFEAFTRELKAWAGKSWDALKKALGSAGLLRLQKDALSWRERQLGAIAFGGFPKKGQTWQDVHPSERKTYGHLTEAQKADLFDRMAMEGKALLEDLDATWEKYKAMSDTMGGRVWNGDLVNRLLGAVQENPTIALEALEKGHTVTADAMFRVSTDLKKRVLASTDKSLPVVVTVGGQSSGKTRGIMELDAGGAILDSTHHDTNTLVRTLQGLLDAGRRVSVVLTERSPEEAVAGMLDRALEEGRAVPLHRMAEAHAGAPNAWMAAMEKFGRYPSARFARVADGQRQDGNAGLRAAQMAERGDLGFLLEQAYIDELRRVEDGQRIVARDVVAYLNQFLSESRKSEAYGLVYRGRLGGEAGRGETQGDREGEPTGSRADRPVGPAGQERGGNLPGVDEEGLGPDLYTANAGVDLIAAARIIGKAAGRWAENRRVRKAMRASGVGYNFGDVADKLNLPSRLAQKFTRTFGYVYEEIKRWHQASNIHEARHAEGREPMFRLKKDERERLFQAMAEARFEENEAETKALQDWWNEEADRLNREAEAAILPARKAQLIQQAERAKDKAESQVVRGKRFEADELAGMGFSKDAIEAYNAYLADFRNQLQELVNHAETAALVTKVKEQAEIAKLLEEADKLEADGDTQGAAEAREEAEVIQGWIDSSTWLAERYRDILRQEHAYVPLVRHGNDVIQWWREDKGKDGKVTRTLVGQVHGEAGLELKQKAEALVKAFPELEEDNVQQTPVLNWKKAAAVDPKGKDYAKMHEAIRRAGLSDKAADLIGEAYEILNLQEIYGGSFKRHLQKARGVLGYETDPIMAHAKYTMSAGKYAAHLQHSREIMRRISELNRDKDFGVSKHQDAVNYLRDLVRDTYQNPVKPWVTTAQSFVAGMSMGLNPAFMVQQMLQKVTHELPMFTAVYGSRVAKTGIGVARRLATKMALKGESPESTITPEALEPLRKLNPKLDLTRLANEAQDVLRRAEKEGIFLDSIHADTIDAAQGKDSDALRLKKRASKAIFYFIAKTEEHNRRQTFLAQYLLSRAVGFPVAPGLDPNLDGDKIGSGRGAMTVLGPRAAETLAGKQVDWIHNRRGATNRSKFQRGMGGIGMFPTQFRYFVVEYLQEMGEVYQMGLDRALREGKSVRDAKIAATLPVMNSAKWLVMAAGIAGLPFLTGLLDMLQALWNEYLGPAIMGSHYRPTKYWRTKVQEAMADAGLHPMVQDVVMRGLPSLAGVSLERSLGMGDVVRLDRGKSAVENALPLVAGPSGQVVEKAGNAFRKAGTGPAGVVEGALEFAPRGVSNATRAARGINRYGDGFQEPMGAMERVGKALGFTSLDAARKRDIVGRIDDERMNRQAAGQVFATRVAETTMEYRHNPTTENREAMAEARAAVQAYNKDMAEQGRRSEMVSEEAIAYRMQQVKGGGRRAKEAERRYHKVYGFTPK